MRPSQHYSSLPALLSLLTTPALAGDAAPTAIKKISPDPQAKILSEHLGFALPSLLDGPVSGNETTRFYPSYNLHDAFSQAGEFRRAMGALSLLSRRSNCPGGFGDCSSIGSPNKCCAEGTFCSQVQDSGTGNVACCPSGATCGGAVGECPSDAVSCAADLGGGCCIAGYICEGVGCVLSAAATRATRTQTQMQSETIQGETETITETQTTMIRGKPSTVVVTVVVTEGSSVRPETRTTTITRIPSQTEEFSSSTSRGAATGGAPYRPTITSEQATTTTTTTTAAATSETTVDTQSGCPTGFYGCLATHGGGCCRTDRNCDIYDCPASASTTVESDGADVVVPASGVPASATATCAGGWFLCGQNAGPVAGCCPSGFSCGTASCFTTTASRTEARQKEFPTQSRDSGASLERRKSWVCVLAMLGAVVVATFL